MMVSNAAAQARENARQKDGKFGVQQKAESGLTLTVPENESQPADFTPLPPVSEYEDVRDDQGRLMKRKYLVERGDSRAECLEVYYPRTNQLQYRIYRDTEGSLVGDAHVPGEVDYFPSGALASVTYKPGWNYVKDYLQGVNESFLFREEYSEDGVLREVYHQKVAPIGIPYIAKSYLYKNGNVKFVMNFINNNPGRGCLPNDIPDYEEYYEDGQLRKQEWHQDLHIHREGAPAVIEYDPDGNVESEKYYSEGREVSPQAV